MTWARPNDVEIRLAAARVDELLAPTMRAALTGEPLAIALALALMDRRAYLLPTCADRPASFEDSRQRCFSYL